MEHWLRRKYLKLNSDTDARNEIYLKEEERRKEDIFLYKNTENEQMKNNEKGKCVSPSIGPYLTFPDPCPPRRNFSPVFSVLSVRKKNEKHEK